MVACARALLATHLGVELLQLLLQVPREGVGPHARVGAAQRRVDL
jgi:hypothetical protein